MARGDDNLRIRVPAGMLGLIKTMAVVNKRSMNAEVIALLQSAIDADGLRDRFAGQALPSIIAATSAGQHQPTGFADGKTTIIAAIAADAYALADAMIAERDRTHG